jgi:hypothetical protein
VRGRGRVGIRGAHRRRESIAGPEGRNRARGVRLAPRRHMLAVGTDVGTKSRLTGRCPVLNPSFLDLRRIKSLHKSEI